MGETSSPRPGEELNLQRLAVWLSEPLASIEQFPGGHSNLTYLVRTSSGGEMVLRRPPMGPLAPKAHDMVREARLLQAVHPHFGAAPRVLAICEDVEVLGAPFFLMERRWGLIVRNSLPAELAGQTGAISEGFLDTLVRLHSIDVGRPELRWIGKPEGFLERQVAGWGERWRRSVKEPMVEMEPVLEWLAAKRPETGGATLVHNDYKLDNLMLSERAPGEVAAVLDWEMATLGDPLADLGLALTYWVHADVPGLGRLTAAPGFWSRDRMVEEYARRSGREVLSIAYYEVLGVFKLAVILQQIYRRYLDGQTRDERFASFGAMVEQLGAKARELMDDR